MADGVQFSVAKDNMSDEMDNNPWDDTLLIKAYDRAVNLAKSNLEKNMINSNTNSKNDNKTDSFKEANKVSDNYGNGGNNNAWKVGSHCRVVWAYDGIEYEAEIVSMKGRNQARVKFVGYNNEENTKLSLLKPSKGEAARQKQILDSQCDNLNEENGMPHQEFNVSQSSVPPLDAEAGMMFPPPPPPHVISYLPKDEQEALSAMLMSWYMSGYHTGYYQGLLNARQNSSNKRK